MLTTEKALILAGIKCASSDYPAAIAILTKCLDQEFGQSNGFKPPTLDREGGSTLSPADLANPWAKFGGSASPMTDGTPRGEGAGAAAAAAAVPVPGKGALIQPTHTYMDDINHEVLGSMVGTAVLYKLQA